jgi:two-component system response regulator AtoC
MKKRHVLIAEDDGFLSMSLSAYLKKKEYQVSTAPDGQRAWELIANSENGNKIDLLITDINMPELNGLELIHRILKNEIALPVIVMTSETDEEIFKELEQAGIRNIIQKPFMYEAMAERADNLIPRTPAHQ